MLIENVRHHVEEEEGEFFPKVRNELGRNDARRSRRGDGGREEVGPTHPHPRSPEPAPATSSAGTIAGVVDRVGDNVSGIAQGSVTAVQDLIARVTGIGPKPKVSPTGSTTARKRANGVRARRRDGGRRRRETARSAEVRRNANREGGEVGRQGHCDSARKSSRRDQDDRQAGRDDDRPHRDLGNEGTAATAKRSASKTATAASGSRR